MFEPDVYMIVKNEKEYLELITRLHEEGYYWSSGELIFKVNPKEPYYSWKSLTGSETEPNPVSLIIKQGNEVIYNNTDRYMDYRKIIDWSELKEQQDYTIAKNQLRDRVQAYTKEQAEQLGIGKRVELEITLKDREYVIAIPTDDPNDYLLLDRNTNLVKNTFTYGIEGAFILEKYGYTRAQLKGVSSSLTQFAYALDAKHRVVSSTPDMED